MRPTIVLLAWLTAGLLAPAVASAQENPFASCQSAEPIRMSSQTPESIPGRPGAVRWTLTGAPVVIVCDDTVLEASTIIYESDTRNIVAEGQVALRQVDLTVWAERAEMDGKTKLGKFFNAAGMARIGDGPPEKSQFGTMEPDITFAAEIIEKVADRKYHLTRFTFTTCAQPTPRWEMKTGSGTITLDKYALLKGVVLKVKDVPLLYLPAFYYPMDKRDRSTGFLLPTYGSSTLRGTTFSNAFFLAISRSQDATFFHDWTSKSGQGLGAQYRYVRASDSRGSVNFYVFNTPPELDTAGTPIGEARRSLQLDGDANQGLPHGFRLFGRTNYFTDAATQQLYQDVYESSQRQQRSLNATINGNVGRYRISGTFDRSDYFYGGEGQRNGRLPSVNIQAPDRAIGRSKIYVGASGEAVYLVRQEDLADPTTDHSLWRFDGGTRVRAPLSTLSFLSVTGDASWRVTRWLESYDRSSGEAVQVPVGLTRQLLEMRAQVVGPTFSRIFQTPNNKYADRFKHVIEPTFTISRTTTFREFDRVVQNDYSVDGQVGGVTQIDYGLSNKILARRPAPAGPPGAPQRPGITRQIIVVNLYQSYYSDALAASFDPQYQTTVSNPGTFSPLRLQASIRPHDEVTGEFGLEVDAKVRAITIMNASSRIDFDRLQVSATWSKRRRIAGLPGFEIGSHFLGANATVRARDNHVGGSYRFNYDFGSASWVQQRIMGYYNSQCCGVSFDWQSVSTPLWTNRGVPTNHQFALSFTLAGIGSFSNPMGSFGGR